MLYFEERSSLVIITRSLLLTQYHVSDDGRVQRAAQVKLSVPQDVAVKVSGRFVSIFCSQVLCFFVVGRHTMLFNISIVFQKDCFVF